ncbi:MAG: geranylgeranyl reductase family protein [Gemmatimonadaceae bacterium]
MTTARWHADAIVVGGGPAGAYTAWALARAGLDVLILDRARFPRGKPCAEYLSPEASRYLAEMGVLATVEKAGAAQLAGMTVRAPNGALIHGDFAAAHGFRGFRDRGLALRRELLDTILLDAARMAGARVEEGTKASDVHRDASGRVVGVSVVDRDGLPASATARCVVGADGLRSVVARRLGLTRVRPWPRRLALVTHYRGVAGVGSHGEMHVERDGYMGIADVGGGETNVAIVVPARHAHAIGRDRETFFDGWIARHPQLRPRFAHAARTSPIHLTGPFASHARRAWDPGAALVGDAADFFDPFTGEGIYAALKGADLLAPYVVDAVRASTSSGADAALGAYDRARRHAFRGKWRVEMLIGAAVGRPWLMNRAATLLETRRDMADLLVGVAGDFVPASEVLSARFLTRLFLLPRPRARTA